MSALQIIKQAPTIEQYKTLCKAVGWQNVINFEAAEISLRNSVFGMTVLMDDQLAGMGRIVGDGAMYFYLQDIAVAPDFQGYGIGTLIMETLLNHIKQNAPAQAFVGIFAAPDAMKLYERYGFIERDLVGVFNVTPL